MEKILNNPEFQATLAEIAQQNNLSYEKVSKEAAKYLSELYTAQHPFANVIAAQAAQYLLSRGYNKNIDVNPGEIRQITKIMRKYPVAFVMTHKTYIDMFVLGVVLARHGLPLPHIFAGINMSFFGLGQFGRQTGTIFIRRSFKENLVYKATLRHYIAILIKEKHHFMWAIEGTRSRTGKLVWPKMGILKYIREAEQDTGQEVKYVPVSIVYDLIPDVKEMIQEGRGKIKNPESLLWWLNYLKKMGDKFGRISLRIGQPVQTQEVPKHPIYEEEENEQYTKDSVSRFALELAHRINQITPVTTTSLICISLLSKFALGKRAIESDVAFLMQFIENHKPDALVDRGIPLGESVQVGLNLLSHSKIVHQQGDALRAKYRIASRHYLQANYYANMAVHHFYYDAFIELSLLHIMDLPVKGRSLAFWSYIMQLRDIFKFEFFYPSKAQFTDEIEEDLELISRNDKNIFENPDSNIKALLARQKLFVAPVVLYNYIEAYRVVGQALLSLDNHQPFEEEKFIANCLLLGEEMHWQGKIHRIGSVSKPFLINGLRLARNRGLISATGESRIQAIRQFISQLEDVSKKINTLKELTLSHTNEIVALVPVEREIVPGSKTESITEDIMKGESGAHIGAFFDLDRTLIRGFSAKEFFLNRLLSGRMTAREIVAQFAGVLVYATGNGNFASLAAVGAQGVKGIDERIFIEVGEEVYLKYLAGSIYPEARALVAAHLAKGHTVAIVSAATPYQVNPIARDLGIEEVMCTRMEVQDGKFTGSIVEPACWGEGKAHAAMEITAQFNLDLSKSYFYTDSSEDLPLLEIVGYPRPMNPDTKLSALAFENDWPVYRFNYEEPSNIINIARTTLALGSLIPAAAGGAVTGALHLSWKDGINSMMASVGDLVTKLAGIKLVVKCEENLWSHRPAVFLFNHQSSVDIFIAAKLIRKDATGIAKKELQMAPVIGQLMMAAGVIFIDRSNSEKAIEAMKPAEEALKNGTSIIIFPEGTRSYDYKLGSFKKGAFHLAMQAGAPLVPVVIRNAIDAMPKGSNVFRPTAVEVVVLPPVSTKKWTTANLDQNIARVRQMFLHELRQEETDFN